MKTDFPRYGNLTPEELNAALAATGSAYRVPGPYTPPDAGAMQMPDGSVVAVAPPPVQTYAPPAPTERVVFDAQGRPIERPAAWTGVDAAQRAVAPQEQLAPVPTEVAPSPDQAPPPPAPRPGQSPMRKFAQGVRAQAETAQGEEDMARQAVAGSVEEQARIQNERAAQIEESNARQLEIRKQQAAEAEALGARMQRKQEAADAEKKAAFESYKQMNAQAAQVQIRDSRSTTERVLGAVALVGAGIATGYSGAAAALAGGQKTDYLQKVLTTIETGIQKDLETQRLNAQGKRDAASAARDEWQIAGQFARDKQEQTELARAALERKHAQALDAEAQSLTNKDAAATARQGAAALRQTALEREYGIAAQRSEKAGDRAFALDAAQAQAAARGGMSAMDRERLRGAQLDNALKEQKLKGGPRPEGAEAQKLQRIVEGAEPAARNLAAWQRKSQSGETLPYAGVAGGGKMVPDVLTPTENLNYRNDVDQLAQVALRDESGGAIGAEERAQKLEAYGVFSGDPDVRKRGLDKLMFEYESKRKMLGLDSITETAALTSSGFVGGGSQ